MLGMKPLMRIAIVSDIHGNRTAFEAVLADLRQTAPDLILHGGDLVDGGASPVEIVDQIRDLGWQGVVISDDMQMGAIRKAFGYGEALRLAIEAGIDILTIAQQQVFEPGIVARTIDLITGLVANGTISEARIDASYRRILALKAAA